jgi:sugar phosphate isomerase/epimerase
LFAWFTGHQFLIGANGPLKAADLPLSVIRDFSKDSTGWESVQNPVLRQIAPDHQRINEHVAEPQPYGVVVGLFQQPARIPLDPMASSAGIYNRLVPDYLTRRDAGKSLLTGLAATSAVSAAARRPLGFQLYTVRKLIPDQARETLKRLSQIGYREVESVRASNSVVLPLCQEFGVKVVSAHQETPLITGNFDAWKDVFPQGAPQGLTWQKAVDDAAQAGLQFMVIPYLMPAERGSLEDFQRYADQFNKAGQAVRNAGMQLCYHHHSFEFGTKNGWRPIDVFLERLDPDLVKFEMDVFWVSVAGEDPVALLKKWKGRVPLIHLKDKAPGLKTHFAENLSPNAYREIELGVLDFPKILAAARDAGIQHFFVEQDEVAEDAVESLHQSYRALESLKF